MANIGFAFNLTVTQGDDRPIEFIFTDEDDQPIDISLWLFRYTAKVSVDDPDTAAEIQLDPGDFTLSTSVDSGAVVNKASALIPKASTDTMAVASYPQDIQVTKPDGSITTIGSGQLVIEAQVTQRTS